MQKNMGFTNKKFKGKPDCSRCRHYQFSITLGSPDKPIWHCRFGFEPKRYKMNSFVPPLMYDCRDNAQYNVDIMNRAVQLTLPL